MSGSLTAKRITIEMSDAAYWKMRGLTTEQKIPMSIFLRNIVAAHLGMSESEFRHHEPQKRGKKTKLAFTSDIAAKKTIIERRNRGFSRQSISAITHLPYKQVDRICTEAGL